MARESLGIIRSSGLKAEPKPSRFMLSATRPITRLATTSANGGVRADLRPPREAGGSSASNAGRFRPIRLDGFRSVMDDSPFPLWRVTWRNLFEDG
jgi:hypothetical protein